MKARKKNLTYHGYMSQMRCDIAFAKHIAFELHKNLIDAVKLRDRILGGFQRRLCNGAVMDTLRAKNAILAVVERLEADREGARIEHEARTGSKECLEEKRDEEK